MNILLTNDDGIDAAGLWSLHKAFVEAGHQVWVIAPKYEQSAKSHSITTRDPLRVEKIKERVYAVTGTPADCVIMGFEHLLKDNGHLTIDLVVSGINAGQNLGDDVIYSGTVAAAVEAACYGVKAVAISSTIYSSGDWGTPSKEPKYDTASRVLLHLIDRGLLDFLGYRELVNINVPNIDFEQLQGYVVCQTGYRRYQNIIHQQKDHRGNDIYWLGGDNPLVDKSDYELDTFAIKENKVAISPLRIDLNDYEKLEAMNRADLWG